MRGSVMLMPRLSQRHDLLRHEIGRHRQVRPPITPHSSGRPQWRFAARHGSVNAPVSPARAGRMTMPVSCFIVISARASDFGM